MRRPRLPSPAMMVALVALVFSTTGLADAARRAVVSAIDGHPISASPHAGGVLLLGSNRKFPASAIPTVHEATRLDGKTAGELEGSCPPDTVNLGSYCMESAPYPLTKEDLGKNNFIFASKTCQKEGGWLPSASELLGAAERVKLESTIHDSQLTATIDLDPTRGLKDEREMSSTLVTTEAGSAAAGSRASAKAPPATPARVRRTPCRYPRTRCPNRCSTSPSTATARRGALRAPAPVIDPENFRCAYNKTPGAVNKSTS